jgi:hypothetical protein
VIFGWKIVLNATVRQQSTSLYNLSFTMEWYGNYKFATGPKNTKALLQRFTIIRDMLEYFEAKYKVKSLVRES